MIIEIFPSASGDCLLVTSADGKRLLADAGLPDAYDAFIAKPLAKLRQAPQDEQEGTDIDVVYVSHIDQDHIGGVLRMLDHEMKWRAYRHSQDSGGRLRKPAVPRPPRIGQIWHNAFLEDIERTEKIDLGASLGASASALSGLNAAIGDRTAASLAAETAMLALSVGDAIQVDWRIGTDQLAIPLNPDFAGGLMIQRPDQPIDLGSIRITVLGPTEKELKELRRDWIAWLKKSGDYLEKLRKRHQRDVDALGAAASPQALAGLAREAAEAVETDVTPPNLASLVLLVEEQGGQRLLLTGDAGDESLLGYLKATKLLDTDGNLFVDVLKVPHHGAHNSFSPDFAKAVRAKHLIFCGDGEHHNPEPEVVAGYLDAISAEPLPDGAETTFWFNWSSERAERFKDLWGKVEALFERPGLTGIRRRSLRSGEDSMVLELP